MSLQQFRPAVCFLLLVCVGCGAASPTGGPVSVSGTVTVAEDKPLPHGIVEFQSLDDKELVRQARVTDGKFSLDQGLVSGEYGVRILPYEPEVEELPQIPEAQRREINESRNLIPTQFHQPKALAVKLSAGQKNSFKFDLSKLKTAN